MYINKDYSGSDIKVMSKEAIMGAVREVIGSDWDTKKQKGNVVDNVVIKMKHIESALQNVKPSCDDLADKYRAWFKQFGAC